MIEMWNVIEDMRGEMKWHNDRKEFVRASETTIPKFMNPRKVMFPRSLDKLEIN